MFVPFVRNVRAISGLFRLSSRYLHFGSRMSCPINIKMPSLSPTMENGTIIQWHKKEGDAINPGDLLCEVQTDKAVVGLETEEEGILAKIIKGPTSGTITVGEIVAVVAGADEDWKAVAAGAGTSPPVSLPADSKPASPPVILEAPPPSTVAPPSPDTVPALTGSMLGPAVRLLLEKHSLDRNQVTATGPHGQLLKGDVLAFVAGAGTQKKAAGLASSPVQALPTKELPSTYIDIPLSATRSAIAQQYVISNSSIPASYTHMVCFADKLFALRDLLNMKTDAHISINDLIIKASAFALRLVPDLNAISDPSGLTLRRLSEVNIQFIVALPDGCAMPVINSVDRLNVSRLSSKIKDLVSKARTSQLDSEDTTGAGFTVTNLGMYGVSEFADIINSPQVGILAVGKAEASIGLLKDLPSSSISMKFTLSADARFVDECTTSAFLNHLKHYIEECPEALLHGDPLLAEVQPSRSSFTLSA